MDRITEIEAICFPKAEAAAKDAFEYRIRTFPECFFVAERNGQIIGFINGCVTNRLTICDDLYQLDGGHDPNGQNQTIFGLVVEPGMQRQGYAEQLMYYFIDVARARARKKIILTCKDKLIHYYEKFGYVNCGISESAHGGSVWYDMVLKL